MGIVAKYKFDGSVYADLIPEFNEEFTDYNITDEVEGNIITRTIESDSLPTSMRFGCNTDSGAGYSKEVTNKELCLLEILDMDTSNLTTMRYMFRHCSNLTSITCDWNTTKVTNITKAFNECHSLINLDVSNWDTSNINGYVRSLFSQCRCIENLDVSNWDTSKMTNMGYMFYNCQKLQKLDLHNWNVDNVNAFDAFIEYCADLTTLDISNFNINANNISSMIGNTPSLKYIKCNMPSTIQTISSQLPTKTSDNQGTIICKSDIASLDTDTLQSKYWNVATNPQLIAKYKYDSKIYKNLTPVFNEGYMGFVEDEKVDENGIVTRVIEHVELPTKVRFGYITHTENTYSYAYKDIQYVNCTKISSIDYMFRGCTTLINLDVSGWNLSKITNCNTCFADCISMTSIIGLDMIDVSESVTFAYMFSACKTLQKLDISNFKIKSDTNLERMFSSTHLLTDIGMIYCDQSTINTVASLLPTDHNITIWVESDDILQYDQYDHITYKTQKVQDTVHLNSPLLIGDTIEVIDGKTYHVHRYWKHDFNTLPNGGFNVSVIDTSDYIRFYKSIDGLNFPLKPKNNGNIICDYLYVDSYASLETRKNEGIAIKGDGVDLNINLHKNRGITSHQQFVTWVQSQNPFIYELATPYYELISEEPLELTLLDTTDNTINNNSILPSNMTIANKELSTIAIKPSTIYTLSFDKSNKDSEVTIDICGGEQITTVLNRVELTTPSELGSGIRFISSDGCIISNVRLLEGSLVEKAIPKETFEGLKSSFDENYLIGKNIAPTIGSANWIAASAMNGEVMENSIILNRVNGSNNTDVYTSSDFNIKENTNYTVIINIIKNNNITSFNMNGYGGNLFTNPTFLMEEDFTGLLIYHKTTVNSFINISSVRHLQFYSAGSIYSDASVEIGGIYILEGDHTHLSEAELMRYIEKGTSHYEEEDFNNLGKYKVQYKATGKNKFNVYSLTSTSNNFTVLGDKISINTPSQYCLMLNKKLNLIPGNQYVLQGILTPGSEISIRNLDGIAIAYLGDNVNSNNYQSCKFIATEGCYLRCSNRTLVSTDVTFSNIQLEEGSTATSYEPYKFYTKTFYLNSPLLEGDTIEDINGVATHVRRYEKVVLDGSEQYNENSNNTILYSITISSNCKRPISNSVTNFVPFKCDKRVPVAADSIYLGLIGNSIAISKDGSIGLSLDGKTKSEILDDLKNNTVTVVYELKTPIYEPI